MLNIWEKAKKKKTKKLNRFVCYLRSRQITIKFLTSKRRKLCADQRKKVEIHVHASKKNQFKNEQKIVWKSMGWQKKKNEKKWRKLSKWNQTKRRSVHISSNNANIHKKKWFGRQVFFSLLFEINRKVYFVKLQKMWLICSASRKIAIFMRWWFSMKFSFE